MKDINTKTSGERFEPGTYEAWDAGEPLPDYGAHVLAARPGERGQRFPGMGITTIAHTAPGEYLALGYASEGGRSYSVTLQLDRAMLERLVDCTLIAEYEEVRTELLDGLQPGECVDAVGADADFETVVGEPRSQRGVSFVPFVVTGVAPAAEDEESDY